jgi:hypothetical protein
VIWAHYVLEESPTRSHFARENLTLMPDDQVAWLGETVSSFGQVHMGLKVETWWELDNCSNP